MAFNVKKRGKLTYYYQGERPVLSALVTEEQPDGDLRIYFAGLTGGFLAWIYTLLLPSFARSGWIGESFVHDGPFGFALLRPYELLGLSGLDSIAHALFWTMVVNVGLYVAVSLVTSQTIIERSQANQFVDIFGRAAAGGRIWRGRATIGDLRRLLGRFIGEPLAEAAFHRFTRERNRRFDDASPADADIVSDVERQLAGAIGASSARIMVASVLREEMHDIDEVMQMHHLEALFFPGGGGASIAARPGYPTVIVPFGEVPNAPTPPFPDGFDAKPARFGVSFTGTACSEPRLLAFAYAFEQATKRRVPPPGMP